LIWGAVSVSILLTVGGATPSAAQNTKPNIVILMTGDMSKTGNVSGGNAFSRGALYTMLQNRVYLGEITHKETPYPGQHPAIIDRALWDRVQLQL
jgi:hypothetical protein